jgi:hypothetical protein
MTFFRHRLILLACLASLQVPTNGFILPRLDAIRESRLQRHVSTTVAADEDTKTQGEESTRLLVRFRIMYGPMDCWMAAT